MLISFLVVSKKRSQIKNQRPLGSFQYQSFLNVRICPRHPRTWEHISRSCIWPHGTLTPVWFSHRRTSWLRRLTALLPLLRSTCLLCVSIIIASACRGLRCELLSQRQSLEGTLLCVRSRGSFLTEQQKEGYRDGSACWTREWRVPDGSCSWISFGLLLFCLFLQ